MRVRSNVFGKGTHIMMRKLSIYILSTLIVLALCSACASPPIEEHLTFDEEIPTVVNDTEDPTGQAYIDSFVFLGESTTYHLKSRGVLSGGTQTKQVWGPENGTINLDTTIATLRIVYPETGERLTIGEALARKKPRRILFCFGLNGVVAKHRRGKEYFQGCYRLLLDAVRTNSEKTEIYLQSAFPVAKNMDVSSYSVDVDTLNRYIDTINTWTRELANEYGATYLNTAELLKDQAGRLRIEYQIGDGHHLTAEAYRKMLSYIIEKQGDTE